MKFFSLFTLFLQFQICQTRRVHEVSKMLDFLVGDSEGSPKYDKTLRPNFGGPPLIVGVTINVDSLGPIDEVKMNFRLDLSFRQFWKDTRLDFSQYPGPDTYDKNLTLSHDFLKRIWVPDTYFPDSLSSSKQDVMVPNVLIRLSPDGSILYSSRTTVIAKCPMDLEVFPMDTQECRLLVECYGYTANEIHLQWHVGNKSVDLPENIPLAQFGVIGHFLLNYTLHFSTGSFSDLEVKFLFKRDLLYFILQSYVPSTFIVMCSMVAFWINREGIPGRACLSITTVLSLITLIGSTNSKLPNVSAVKALDVYFGLCFVYVFGGLFEFATVIYLSSKEKKMYAVMNERKKKKEEYWNKLLQTRESNLLSDLDLYLISNVVDDSVDKYIEAEKRGITGQEFIQRNGLTSCVKSSSQQEALVSIASEIRRASMAVQAILPQVDKPKKPRITASRIEVCARICFPTSFLIFVTIYWMYYLYLSKLQMKPRE